MKYLKNTAEMLHKMNFWIFLIVIAFSSYLGRDIILYNAVAAKIKIMLGIYNIEVFDERGLYEEEEYEIARKLGFIITRHHGCVISEIEVNGINGYNAIMKEYIDKNICSNFEEKLQKYVQLSHERDSVILESIKKDSTFINSKDIYSYRDCHFEISQKSIGKYEVMYYGYNATKSEFWEICKISYDTNRLKVLKIATISKKTWP